MGEVYRARDTRLDRRVAIKILQSHLSCSPELKGRFEREARTLSSLCHPHICSLYDVGTEAGVEFLVMELLEGETLSARLQRGPLPVSAVVKLGIEMADALTKAHKVGVIHRDLKPGNIMMTANGAKLMDFGLAKPNIANTAANSAPSLSDLVTATVQSPATPLSTAGTVIGTIQYMAPEQLEGKEADERSDIFALGTVLYESVTGRRAFQGKSHLSVASAILQKDPPPISAVHDVGLAPLEYLIRACMAKEPEERFQTAHDVKLQLTSLAHSPGAPPPQKRPTPLMIAMGALILTLLITVFFLGRGVKKPAGSSGYGLTRFTIALPAGQELGVNNTQAVVLSPDGKRLAYVATEKGLTHLYTRRLDQFESVAIPDSEGAVFPFFSPNGEWIAFFNQGKLKKAPSIGGVPIVITEVPTFFGGTWTPQDVIVAAVPTFGLATVSANGGTLQKVPMNTKENFYPEGPIWMAGGEWIAFTDYLAEQRTVTLMKLNTGEVKTVLKAAQAASYVAGHLVYYQGGALWAVPFEPNQGTIQGSPTQVESGINEENYIAQASTSENGVLAYAPGPAGNFARNLYVVDRKGQEKKLDVPPQDYVDPAISPDGKQIVIMFRGVNGQQLVVLDRDRGLFTTLVSSGLNASPAWLPDGKTLMYDGVDSQRRAIYRIAADGSGAPQVYRTTSLSSHVTSAAGEYAAVQVNDPATSMDLWLLNVNNPEDIRPFKRTPAAERQGALSPDGHWIAYASNESGRSEIYVEPVPGPGGRRQISPDGGAEPRWVRNGKEIVYRSGTKLMSVPVQLQPTFAAGRPVELFDRKYDGGLGVAAYDITRDGQTFVFTRSEHEAPREIRVVMGWTGNRSKE
jgi:Tol biopolymer transport system component/tRNA A-37 threonylcarbamoyl transferase component Bud32